MLRWRECGIWACALLLVQVVNFNGFFLRGEVLVPSDMLFRILPWRDHQPPDFIGPSNSLMYDPVMAFRPDFQRFQDALRAGRWPLWNDMEMGGLPLLANCQSRVFYFPHLALAFLDVDTAISIFIVFKLWLAAFVAYVSARVTGFGIWPSRWFSVVWGFGCLATIWAYWPITDVLVWVPVVFAGTEWLIEHRYRKGFFALALGGALLLFAGHPETAFAVNSYIGLYFVIRLAFAWYGGEAPWKPITLYTSAWALAIAVYAVQLLPFIEYLQHSAPVEERIDMPLTFSTLSTFWVPRFLGVSAEDTFWDKNTHNSNLTIQQYVGIAAWLGTAIALAGLRRNAGTLDGQSRARIAAITFATLASVAMSMDLFFLEWAQRLPGFSHMRTIYHVFFALFGVPLLGLIGLDIWFSRPRKLHDLAMVLIVIVPAALLVAGIWNYNARLIAMSGLSGYITREMGTAVIATVLLLGTLALHSMTNRKGIVWATFIVLSGADTFWPVRGLNPSLERANLPGATPLVTYMQNKEKPCRFDVLGAAIAPGAIGNFGIEEWDGYDGLYPERPVRFREKLSNRIWKSMYAATATDYYLNDPSHEELVPIRKLVDQGALKLETSHDHIDVYRHVTMPPRARLVGKLEALPNSTDLFARMLGPGFDPRAVAVTDLPPDGTLPDSDLDFIGDASIVLHEPERIDIHVNAADDAVLVLAENYFPGWQATVDEKTVPVFPVYYCFRGILVPKGEHNVEFRYQPRSLAAGIALSSVALIASLAASIRLLRPRTK